LLKPRYAILIDGGFLKKKLSERLQRHPLVADIIAECERLQQRPEVDGYELLRIYWYDGVPASATIPLPVSKQALNLTGTERYRESKSLLDQLVLWPNFSLRLGEVIVSRNGWRLKPNVAGRLIKEPRELRDEDFVLDAQQKGVDVRIGMDMARLALREMVRQVIVVTGDSDFVPAFKFVRREGVRVILEPMGQNVLVELKQHADIVL
jgi:uncharacterized LabA/DUF88 family protein